MRMDRRRFVSTAAAGIVGTSVTVRGTGRAVQGANDRITVGLIGCGGMGRSNLQNFLRMGDVQVAAVCDLYEFNRNRALKLTEGQKSAEPVAAVADFRRVLDRKDIDAVIVATPDHWHAIPTILACDAGKDVYVEKPLAHNVREGRLMVQAAKRNNRVLQMGTQQRSGAHFREAVDLVRGGAIGKVTRVATWNFGNQWPHGAGNHAGLGPADRPRLGLLPRARAQGTVQYQPLHLELPLVLGLRRRDDDRLGRAPHRYRALGDERQRPARRHGGRQQVRPPGQP